MLLVILPAAPVKQSASLADAGMSGVGLKCLQTMAPEFDVCVTTLLCLQVATEINIRRCMILVM